MQFPPRLVSYSLNVVGLYMWSRDWLPREYHLFSNHHAYTCIHHRIQLAVGDMTMSGWKPTISLIHPPPITFFLLSYVAKYVWQALSSTSQNKTCSLVLRISMFLAFLEYIIVAFLCSKTIYPPLQETKKPLISLGKHSPARIVFPCGNYSLTTVLPFVAEFHPGEGGFCFPVP